MLNNHHMVAVIAIVRGVLRLIPSLMIYSGDHHYCCSSGAFRSQESLEQATEPYWGLSNNVQKRLL